MSRIINKIKTFSSSGSNTLNTLSAATARRLPSGEKATQLVPNLKVVLRDNLFVHKVDPVVASKTSRMLIRFLLLTTARYLLSGLFFNLDIFHT